jgi:hypothetical protein
MGACADIFPLAPADSVAGLLFGLFHHSLPPAGSGGTGLIPLENIAKGTGFI